MTQKTIPHRMRWWGWGVEGHDKPITTEAETLLREEIGLESGADNPPKDISEVTIPSSRLDEEDISSLNDVVSTLSTDHDTRVRHALGRSYPDLARLRTGVVDVAPDAVAMPADEKELQALLKVCTERKIAVTAFGGGTSVVGGVEAVDGGFGKAIALSMVAFDAIVDINRKAHTVTVQAGVFGPDLEEALQPLGLTVGHFPQSFEFSTVGGWAACRSAGQESSGYGRIDDNVIGMRVVTPAGTMEFRDSPATASGPNPRQVFLGSEGTLGIITQVTLQLHDHPDEMLFDTYFVNSFEEGLEIFRELEQDGNIPHLARLSDESETRFGIEQMGGGIGGRLRKYLSLRGIDTPCMILFGFGQQSKASARAAREVLSGRLLRKKCVRLGPIPGQLWVKHRFTSPYLRDVMMTRRVGVDTLETSTTWEHAAELRQKIMSRMRAAAETHGTPAYVFCHISHLYESGCSLYFTYFFRENPGQILNQWMDIKNAAGSAILDFQGTITHHHGVGQDHSPQNYVENTELFAEALRGMKKVFDPAGILNPGKLQTGPHDLRERYAGDEV